MLVISGLFNRVRRGELPVIEPNFRILYFSFCLSFAVNIIVVLNLAGELNFLSLAAVILTAPLLAALGFVFFLPVLRFWRLSADGVFPRLTWRYLVVVAYGLLLAVVLTLGEISRFPFLAAALQSIGLGAVLGFKVLEGRRGGATSDVVTEGASRRRRGSVALTLALAGIVVVTAFVYFWSPAAGFLITDACHDAGGRMLANGVCEFGPSGPN